MSMGQCEARVYSTCASTCTTYTCQHVCICTCSYTIGKHASWIAKIPQKLKKKILISRRPVDHNLCNPDMHQEGKILLRPHIIKQILPPQFFPSLQVGEKDCNLRALQSAILKKYKTMKEFYHLPKNEQTNQNLAIERRRARYKDGKKSDEEN